MKKLASRTRNRRYNFDGIEIIFLSRMSIAMIKTVHTVQINVILSFFLKNMTNPMKNKTQQIWIESSMRHQLDLF